MQIKPAEKKDIPKILLMIKREFPGVNFTETDLLHKIESEIFHIFKAEDKSYLAGFVEVEMIADDVARINALAIDSKQKGKQVGRDLLKYAIDFLQKKGVERITILVLENNEAAKNLYQEMGFSFISLYQHDNQTIEELELELDQGTPSYVG